MKEIETKQDYQIFKSHLIEKENVIREYSDKI